MSIDTKRVYCLTLGGAAIIVGRDKSGNRFIEYIVRPNPSETIPVRVNTRPVMWGLMGYLGLCCLAGSAFSITLWATDRLDLGLGEFAGVMIFAGVGLTATILGGTNTFWGDGVRHVRKTQPENNDDGDWDADDDDVSADEVQLQTSQSETFGTQVTKEVINDNN